MVLRTYLCKVHAVAMKLRYQIHALVRNLIYQSYTKDTQGEIYTYMYYTCIIISTDIPYLPFVSTKYLKVSYLE